MNGERAIAIFDIGKTNKKLFLFDRQYNILFERAIQFEEITDEDGDPCEDVEKLTGWIRQALHEITNNNEYSVEAVNFSAYGASFVHLDSSGKTVAPLYNYLKPYPGDLHKQFYERYGDENSFSVQTASPVLDSLNSGMQLYRIKYEKPGLFNTIRYSLHLPQYLNFLVTGRTYSDITSIGCHTAMWNFAANHYHEWLQKEGIIKKLAPIYPSNQLMHAHWEKKKILAGVGLHDSSAALIPYLSRFKDPFLLISTGTWCISLNPFNQSRLTIEELQQDCLCYMEYRGKSVKASRLFAGYEHEQQIKKLAAHFNVSYDKYKQVTFDKEINTRLSQEQKERGAGKATVMMKQSLFGKRDLHEFASYEEAYHQLMIDIMKQQVISSGLVLKNCPVKKIFVDGGFGKNPVYMNLLADSFPEIEVYAASIAQASALGAALSVHAQWNKESLPQKAIDLLLYNYVS